jgi:hypothetical protein
VTNIDGQYLTRLLRWSLLTQILKGSYAPGIKEVCVIEADLGHCKLHRQWASSPRFHVEFSIAIYFGGTTLAAKLLWDEYVSICAH